MLVACAFNYEAHATEFNKLGRIPVLKARMNADLHMADDLKNTGKGNLFVIFGEPDITILPEKSGQLRVKVNGVDVFHPNTGEVRSDLQDVYDTERQLLYVACTRARDALLVTSVEPASEFLDDLRS